MFEATFLMVFPMCPLRAVLSALGMASASPAATASALTGFWIKRISRKSRSFITSGESHHILTGSLRQFSRVEEERIATVFVSEPELWTASAPWPSGCPAALAVLLSGQASDILRRARAASPGRPLLIVCLQKQEAKVEKYRYSTLSLTQKPLPFYFSEKY